MKEEKPNLKELYKKFQNKLPKFEILDEEFELSSVSIKDDTFLIRTIRRRVNEKVVFYCRIIEGLLYPNTNNFMGMLELKSFDDDEKNKMFELYKKLMLYERGSLILDVNPNEKEDFNYINKLWKDWVNFKKELIKITEKMKNSWHEKDEKIKENYFG